MKPLVLFVGLLPIFAACGRAPSSSVPRNPVANPSPEPWSVTTLDPHDPTPAWLSNGKIGIRIGRDGTGGGQPLFSINEYETEGEEKIRTLSNPLSLEISIGGQEISPERASDYRQNLDFRTGILSTSWSQGTGSSIIRLENRTILHPSEHGIAQQWKFLVPPGSKARLTMRPTEGDFKFVRSTSDLSNVHFEFGSTRRRPAYHWAKLSGGWEGIWSHRSGEVEWSGRLLGTKELTLERQFFAYWPTMKAFPIWKPWKSGPTRSDLPDIEVDGPIEDQQAIRSFLFYLRNAIHSDGEMSVAPMGLSNAKYNGHVFWDADIWVFPVIALLDPERAAGIPQYRLDRTERATLNYREWINSDRPIGNGKMGSLANADVPANGIMFPWESSVSGKETQPNDSKYQHHISGSVAFALEQAAALGLADPHAVQKAIEGVTRFYGLRSVRNEDGTFSIKSTMSPDENTFGDNDLYTNLVAQWCINGGNFSNKKPPVRLKLPKDEKSFLTFDNDHEIAYKQAAAVLAIYPLQYPEAEKQARIMMERFEPKVPPNGPAMTDSVHALIWARLGEKERAYQTWRHSWQDFTKHPLMLFSEKRVPSETYFVTGAAGCLQTVIYGFLGFRIDDTAQPGAAWSIPLRNGKVLSIKPNLHPAWKKVTFRNFSVLGKRYTLEATHDKATVTQTR